MRAVTFVILGMLSCLANANEVYQDTNGVHWRRHVLTEARRDQRTLLLVIDEALDANLLPKVITRKSFLKHERMKLVLAMQEANRLAAMSVAPDLQPTNNPLWPIDHQWSEQDERDYDQWIRKVANVDFLVGGGVEVDCADYAIALRWIYAHDHHLPAGDNLTAGKGLFGSWQSTDVWDKLSSDADWRKDERFKAALRYVLRNSYTHSIFTDLYPVAITPDFVGPGTIYLTLETESGHTRTIFSVGKNADCNDPDGCMLIIWGNEPADEKGYITELVPYWLAADGGGFLRFRWPELTANGWQLRDPKLMRGYSSEQYSWSTDQYLENVATRLHLWQTPESRLKVAAEQMDRLLLQRLFVTYDGYLLCSLVPCAPSDAIYADWSTPVRDHAIALSAQNLKTVIAQIDPASQQLQDLKSSLSGPMYRHAPFSEWDIITGDIVSTFNSDPRVDFFARWGVANAGADDRIWQLLEIAVMEWALKRGQLVMQAQNLCFPNGGEQPTCNPADPRVQKLSTARLDQGFRELRKVFLATLAQTSPPTRQKITDLLPKYQDGVMFCGPGANASCSMNDYLLGPIDHWGKMTSNADSPLKARFGF